jgi:hypothetical protein
MDNNNNIYLTAIGLSPGGSDERNKKVYTGFWGNLNERDHLED